MKLSAILVVFSCVGFGQAPDADLVLRFAHTDTPQSLHEIATAIRSVTEIRQASVATEQRVLAVKGTPVQIAMAEWLFAKLDQTPGPRPSAQVAEYRVPNKSDDLVRVFYLTYPESVQAFQEIATAIRSVAEIRYVFTYNALKAFIVRGTAEQVAMAEWLVNQLDLPASARNWGLAETHEFMTPGKPEDVVQVFNLAHAPTVADLQEMAVMVRSIAEIRRVYTYNGARAIAVRGTPTQISLAAWLLRELDQPMSERRTADRGAIREFRFPASADDIVRLFYLPRTPTVASFQEIVQLIRTQVSLRKVFTYNGPRAFAIRGTLDQMAQAERLTKELDKQP